MVRIPGSGKDRIDDEKEGLADDETENSVSGDDADDGDAGSGSPRTGKRWPSVDFMVIGMAVAAGAGYFGYHLLMNRPRPSAAPPASIANSTRLPAAPKPPARLAHSAAPGGFYPGTTVTTSHASQAAPPATAPAGAGKPRLPLNAGDLNAALPGHLQAIQPARPSRGLAAPGTTLPDSATRPPAGAAAPSARSLATALSSPSGNAGPAPSPPARHAAPADRKLADAVYMAVHVMAADVHHLDAEIRGLHNKVDAERNKVAAERKAVAREADMLRKTRLRLAGLMAARKPDPPPAVSHAPPVPRAAKPVAAPTVHRAAAPPRPPVHVLGTSRSQAVISVGGKVYTVHAGSRVPGYGTVARVSPSGVIRWR